MERGEVLIHLSGMKWISLWPFTWRVYDDHTCQGAAYLLLMTQMPVGKQPTMQLDGI